MILSTPRDDTASANKPMPPVTAAASSLRGAPLRRHVPLIVLELMMLVSAVVAIVEGHVGDLPLPLSIAAGSLLIPVIERMTSIAVPAMVQAMLGILLFTAPFLGSNLGFYDRWSAWDSAVHFFSGFVIASIALTVLHAVSARYRLQIPLWLRGWIIITVGGCAAAVWEVIEFTSDQLLGSHMQRDSLTDTMTDTILALVSTTVFALCLSATRTSRRPARSSRGDGTADG